MSAAINSRLTNLAIDSARHSAAAESHRAKAHQADREAIEAAEMVAKLQAVIRQCEERGIDPRTVRMADVFNVGAA